MGDVGATVFERAPESLWEEPRKFFAASDISSVIALEKFGNDGEWTKADETIWTRQIADPRHVRRKSTDFLGFREAPAETPSLPAKFEARVGSSRNIKIYKHFVAASTLRQTRTPFSQPNPDSQVVLLNKFDRPWTSASRVTFSSAISIRRRPTDYRVVVVFDGRSAASVPAAPGRLNDYRLNRLPAKAGRLRARLKVASRAACERQGAHRGDRGADYAYVPSLSAAPDQIGPAES